MKVDQRQGGYTLLLTLVLLILFAALGFSLMTLTSAGIVKNTKRQEITQSTALSEMGIDRMTKQINTELTDALGENGLPRGKFVEKLEATLKNYRCDNSYMLKLPISDSGTGTFEVCIESVVDTDDGKGKSNDLRKLVGFKSIGTAGNSDKALISKVEIGAELVPETLKYAIGTNILSKNPKNGEGNLLMHGGVDIQGDIKVDGNIVTTDRGYAFLNSNEQWIKSLSPSAKPTIGSKSAKLVLGKKAYTFSSTPGYSSHIAQTDFPTGRNSIYTEQSVISSLFRTGSAPQVVKREPIRSPIGISDKEEIYKYERKDSGVYVLGTDRGRVIQSKNLPTSKVFVSYTSEVEDKDNCIKWKNSDKKKCEQYGKKTNYDDSGTYELRGNNTFKQFSTLGNLTIKENKSNITVGKEGLFIEGDLTIGNTSAGQSTSVSNYSDITIDGPIFVNGKVTIRGANLKSNALIYVNSNSDSAVDIQYSTMNGKTLANNDSGSFIIFSRGNIKISNNSVNQDSPSHIKGFFYSEKDLEMFGVGSNIKIEGGISARRIVLNATRGKSSNKTFSGAQKISSSNYFEGVTGQQTTDSRLQIIYDPEIIKTYSDLKEQEPVIYSVDPPIEKERY